MPASFVCTGLTTRIDSRVLCVPSRIRDQLCRLHFLASTFRHHVSRPGMFAISVQSLVERK